MAQGAGKRQAQGRPVPSPGLVKDLIQLLEPYNYSLKDIHDLLQRCSHDQKRVQEAVANILEDQYGHENGDWSNKPTALERKARQAEAKERREQQEKERQEEVERLKEERKKAAEEKKRRTQEEAERRRAAQEETRVADVRDRGAATCPWRPALPDERSSNTLEGDTGAVDVDEHVESSKDSVPVVEESQEDAEDVTHLAHDVKWREAEPDHLPDTGDWDWAQAPSSWSATVEPGQGSGWQWSGDGWTGHAVAETSGTPGEMPVVGHGVKMPQAYAALLTRDLHFGSLDVQDAEPEDRGRDDEGTSPVQPDDERSRRRDRNGVDTSEAHEEKRSQARRGRHQGWQERDDEDRDGKGRSRKGKGRKGKGKGKEREKGR